MLELAATNTTAQTTVEEVRPIPELTAHSQRTDPHGVEKLHHSAGRGPFDRLLEENPGGSSVNFAEGVCQI